MFEAGNDRKLTRVYVYDFLTLYLHSVETGSPGGTPTNLYDGSKKWRKNWAQTARKN